MHGRDRDLLVETGNGSPRCVGSSTRSARIPRSRSSRSRRISTRTTQGDSWEFDERVAHASDTVEIEHPTPLIRGSDVWPDVADAMAREGFPVTEVLVTARPTLDWDAEAFVPRGSIPTRLVTEGDMIDLGDRAFRVLWLPGHTPGSVGLWDDTDGTLFCGDVVYAEDPLIDQVHTSDVDAYIATMHRLRDLPVRIVHAGHDRSMDRPTMVQRCAAYRTTPGATICLSAALWCRAGHAILGVVTRHATIAGVGSFLPDNRIPNSYFESLVDTSDEWIVERTGIRARNFASEDVAASDLAVEAAKGALDAAGILAEQVDLIVCATLSGDTPIPSTAGDPEEDGHDPPGVRRQRGVRGLPVRDVDRDGVRGIGRGRHDARDRGRGHLEGARHDRPDGVPSCSATVPVRSCCEPATPQVSSTRYSARTGRRPRC